MMKSTICLVWSLLIAAPLIHAQEFESPQINPFSLTKEGNRSSPAFADIDSDNDLDLFTGFNSGDFGFYENIGAVNLPDFGTLWVGPFNISSIGGDATPFLVDLDNDGDLDLFAGGSNSGVWYYENVGTENVASFTFPIANPFSIIGPSGITKPYMVDIDDDNDLDFFMGSTDGNTYFYENTGAVGNPVFALSVTNPFGLMNVGERSAPSFVDIDEDGDFDALIGARDGNLYYFENIGTPNNAVFNTMESNPFNLQNIGDDAKPYFGDLDDDGDLDLMVGSALGDYYYFENITTISSIDQLENEVIEIFPNPANNIVNIIGLNDDSMIDIAILNLVGQLVYEQRFDHSKNLEIDLSVISAGSYFIQLKRNGSSITKKLIKK